MNNFIPAQEYIHKESIGNQDKCRIAANPVKLILNQKYENKEIEGFEVFLINNRQKLDDKLIFIDYEKITHNVFPFLFVAIQTAFELSKEIDLLMNEYGFVRAYPKD